MSAAEGVPVVDISGYGINISEDAAIEFMKDDRSNVMAGEITQALETYGAVILTGHGVQNHVVGDVLAANRRFCLCTDEDKMKYAFDAPTFHGWLAPKVEKFRNIETNEAFCTMGYPSQTNYRWPDDLSPGFLHTYSRAYEDSAELGKRLLTLLGIGIGLEDAFHLRDAYIKRPYNMGTRANYARSLAHKEGDESSAQRLAASTDMSVATIVYQTQTSGFEVKSPMTGTWLPIPYSPDSLLFQVGEALKYVSDGRFPAPLRREIYLDNDADRLKDRQSFVFFINAPMEDILIPLDSSKPVHAMTFRMFLNEKLKKAFNMGGFGDDVK